MAQHRFPPQVIQGHRRPTGEAVVAGDHDQARLPAEGDDVETLLVHWQVEERHVDDAVADRVLLVVPVDAMQPHIDIGPPGGEAPQGGGDGVADEEADGQRSRLAGEAAQSEARGLGGGKQSPAFGEGPGPWWRSCAPRSRSSWRT